MQIIFLKDGSKVFTAGVDKQCKMWDLGSNQCAVVAQVLPWINDFDAVDTNTINLKSSKLKQHSETQCILIRDKSCCVSKSV